MEVGREQFKSAAYSALLSDRCNGSRMVGELKGNPYTCTLPDCSFVVVGRAAARFLWWGPNLSTIESWMGDSRTHKVLSSWLTELQGDSRLELGLFPTLLESSTNINFNCSRFYLKLLSTLHPEKVYYDRRGKEMQLSDLLLFHETKIHLSVL